MAVQRNKQKLLILRQILLDKTDDEHSLSVPEIINELATYGISVERKTVYDDIETLTENGLDVITAKKSHSNSYYVGTRIFQDEELQVLADAIASSKFLSTRKSNEIIKKLQKLTSIYNSNKLKRNVFIENRVKSFNEQIYYNIDAIHEAINENKKIAFKYFEYDMQKKKKLKNNGLKYTVSPCRLIWDSDNYYLLCFCDKHNNISRYRIDRMTDVVMKDEKRRLLDDNEAELADNLCSTFGMYGGEKQNITLELHKDLVNVIIDRFGSGVYMRKNSADTFIANIDVQISPPFWGWLFQFGDRAKIISPENIKNQTKEWLKKIQENY